MRSFSVALAAVLVTISNVGAQSSPGTPSPRPSRETSLVPVLSTFTDARTSELAEAVARYTEDRSALGRRYAVEYSPARTKRLEEFTGQWLSRLRELTTLVASSDMRSALPGKAAASPIAIRS